MALLLRTLKRACSNWEIIKSKLQCCGEVCYGGIQGAIFLGSEGCLHNRRLYMIHLSDSLLADIRVLSDRVSLSDALSNQHLLLTGGTGFFGRWLLALLEVLNNNGAGIQVTVVSRNPTRFLETEPRYHSFNWIKWLATDIRDLYDVPGRPVQLILHAAADTSAVAHSHPLNLFNTITEGAHRVFDLAVRCGAERVLITGSGAQYGQLTDQVRVVESYSGACLSNETASAYGEAKRVQETLAALYAAQYGLEVVLARCFAFSGPGLPLDQHFAIGNFVRDALFSDEVVLQSDGTAVRSYLHGADLAVWLLQLLAEGKGGVAYNVGSDQALSVGELAHQVVERLSPGKPVTFLGARGAVGLSRSFYVPDISRARGLGLDVWTSLDASIDSMARWAKSYGGCI